MSHFVSENKSIYFLIRFAQTKITLFIFFNNWMSKENKSLLLVERYSHVPKGRGNFWGEYDNVKFFETDNSDSRLS